MFNLAFWLSMVLAVQGGAGLLLAGRGKWYGWAIGLAAQPAWIAFGVVTHGYGVCLSSLLYGAIYMRNLRGWRARIRPARNVGACARNTGQLSARH